MINTKQINIINDHDWDELVKKTYGRPYCFQQQGDCRERGTYYFGVPDDYDYDDEIDEMRGGENGLVSLRTWLARDPTTNGLPLDDKYRDKPSFHNTWWERDFYPCVESVANDLYRRGLLTEGEYGIHVDW